jgi:uncharacterized membrane protein YraQ (UPF0718 family)
MGFRDTPPGYSLTDMNVLHEIRDALDSAGMMGWEILWPLILGFFLSGAIQAVVSHAQMSRLLPDDTPRTLFKASALGAASSSCSYAATALARSLFQKGANFTSAMAFEVASTNLVIEIGVIIALMLGWQFTLAEFIGGPLMIIALALIFRSTLKPKMLEVARKQAQKGLVGRMEGHANMHDMSVGGNRNIIAKLVSPQGRTATSHYFVMDWASVYVDIIIGLLIAGALAAWVPESFWRSLFLVDHPTLAKLWGPLIGPLIAVLSFVCSVGNIPLAAVLWNGGISFGGVVSFIFADLIVLPILSIYRKYYGWKMAAYLFVSFYAAMALAGFAIEGTFGLIGLIPDERNAHVLHAGITWNYTTYLNIAFLVFAGALVWRFLRTGGPEMLRMMNSDGEHHSHDHMEH